MRFKDIAPFLLLFVLLFVGLGDRFLPQPLSQASLQSRLALNQFISGLLPGFKPLKPDERTEGEIKRLEP